jgi:hypothetical protein
MQKRQASSNLSSNPVAALGRTLARGISGSTRDTT